MQGVSFTEFKTDPVKVIAFFSGINFLAKSAAPFLNINFLRKVEQGGPTLLGLLNGLFFGILQMTVLYMICLYFKEHKLKCLIENNTT